MFDICDRNIVLENEPLKNHTTFKIGGNAKAVIVPESVDELINIIKGLNNEKYVLLGNGSNVLAPDEGLDCYIIKTSKVNHVTVNGNKVFSECGATLPKIANCALEKSLTGFEFASGIPGTIGGGIVMNAGAYGGELSQVIEKTTY